MLLGMLLALVQALLLGMLLGLFEMLLGMLLGLLLGMLKKVCSLPCAMVKHLGRRTPSLAHKSPSICTTAEAGVELGPHWGPKTTKEIH